MRQSILPVTALLLSWAGTQAADGELNVGDSAHQLVRKQFFKEAADKKDRPQNSLRGWWRGEDGTLVRFEDQWVTVFDQPKRLRFFYHAEYRDSGPSQPRLSVHLRSSLDDAKSTLQPHLQGDALTIDMAGILPKTLFHKLKAVPPEFSLQPLKLGEAKPLPRAKVRAIKKELLRRFQAEQAMRNEKDPAKKDWRIDKDNQVYLIGLIQEVGWIDAQRFGQHASLAAMMITHHSWDLPLREAAMSSFAKDMAAGRLRGPAPMLYGLASMRLQGMRKSGLAKLKEQGKAEVQALLAKAMEAHGGTEKLARIQAEKTKSKGISSRTLHNHELLAAISAKVNEEDEVEFTRETSYLFPDRLKVDTVQDVYMGLNHFRTVLLLNRGQGSKQFSGMVQGSKAMEGKWLTVLKEQAHRKQVCRLVGLQDKASTLLPLGEERMAGKRTVGIRVQAKGFRDIDLFFDKQTGLLVQTRYRALDPDSGEEFTVEEKVTAYQKVDGVVVPKKIVVSWDGEEVEEEEFTEVQLLNTLDEKESTPPLGAGAVRRGAARERKVRSRGPSEPAT